MDDVPQIMEKYKGKEAELMQRLEKKYGIGEGSVVAPVDVPAMPVTPAAASVMGRLQLLLLLDQQPPLPIQSPLLLAQQPLSTQIVLVH